MEMKVETLPPYHIACVRQTGPYGPANVEAMKRLKEWAAQNNLLTESAILLGIPQDDPETTLPENCRYDACLVLSKEIQADDSVSASLLSGGTYMVFKIKHTAEDVRKAWTECFQAIQKNGFRIDDKPVMERYTGDLVRNGLCELCIPVLPLNGQR